MLIRNYFTDPNHSNFVKTCRRKNIRRVEDFENISLSDLFLDTYYTENELKEIELLIQDYLSNKKYYEEMLIKNPLYFSSKNRQNQHDETGIYQNIELSDEDINRIHHKYGMTYRSPVDERMHSNQNTGWSPYTNALNFAATKNDVKAVYYLLNHKYNDSITNSEWKEAYDVALKHDNAEIIELLKKHEPTANHPPADHNEDGDFEPEKEDAETSQLKDAEILPEEEIPSFTETQMDYEATEGIGWFANGLVEEINNRKDSIIKVQQSVHEMWETIQHQNKVIDQYEKMLEDKENEINEKNQSIQQLRDQKDELEKQKSQLQMIIGELDDMSMRMKQVIAPEATSSEEPPKDNDELNGFERRI